MGLDPYLGGAAGPGGVYQYSDTVDSAQKGEYVPVSSDSPAARSDPLSAPERDESRDHLPADDLHPPDLRVDDWRCMCL